MNPFPLCSPNKHLSCFAVHTNKIFQIIKPKNSYKLLMLCITHFMYRINILFVRLEQFIKINLQLSFNAFVPSHAITMNKSKAAIILKVHNVILGFNYFYFQYLPSANTFTNTVSSSNASISCHSLALRFRVYASRKLCNRTNNVAINNLLVYPPTSHCIII